MILIDADVLIDVQRGHGPARAWVQEVGEAEFAVPGIVMLEMLIGSRSRPELSRTVTFMERFQTAWLTERDNHLARKLMETYLLSTGLDLADFLICAQALNRGATLLTFNLRHFKGIADLDAREPYAR